MRFRAIIGAILALAATFRMLCLSGIIPLNFISEDWKNKYEPWVAAGIVFFVGACVFYDAVKNMKN